MYICSDWLEPFYSGCMYLVKMFATAVGSGPTLDLATRLPKLRAVILHSPILSGLRVMYPVKRTYWFDIYKVSYIFSTDSIFYVFLNCIAFFCKKKCNFFFISLQNIDKIPLVHCPILVIHVSRHYIFFVLF